MERNDENRNESAYVTEEVRVYNPRKAAEDARIAYARNAQNPQNVQNAQYAQNAYEQAQNTQAPNAYGQAQYSQAPNAYGQAQNTREPYGQAPYRQPQYTQDPNAAEPQYRPYQGGNGQTGSYRREEVSDPGLVVRTNTNGQKSRKSGGIVLAAVIGFLTAAILASLVFVIAFWDKKSGDPTEETRKPRETTEAGRPSDKETRETETGSPWGSAGELVVSDDLEDKLEEIRDRLKEYYLFEEEAGGTDFDLAMIRAYVNALGDPYTYYYTEEELTELFEEDSGTYSGIGVMIQQDPETMSITITNVFKGSPAEEAGLKVGDVIYKVGDRECGKTDINIVVTWVRGETGTSVELTVYRPSVNDYVTVTSRRETIETPTVEYEMLDGNVGYISLSQFIETTAPSFKKAYQELQAEGMKYLIIDLRNNGGGLVSSVVSIADYLLPKGIVTYLIDKDGGREEYKSDAYSVLDIPCVVLVNGNTASASEILTGALSDYGLAEVVGETTFGKGIVQVILKLSDGTGLKVTMARYYTPNGVCIHGVGIAPDVEVKDDVSTEQDEQLQKALEVVKSLSK